MSGSPSVSSTIEIGFKSSFFMSIMSPTCSKKALKSVNVFTRFVGNIPWSWASICSTVRFWNISIG